MAELKIEAKPNKFVIKPAITKKVVIRVQGDAVKIRAISPNVKVEKMFSG